MEPIHKPTPLALTRPNDLKTLVENRSTFGLSHCELSVFETHERSERVRLQFDDLVFTTMLRGKKVMHLFGQPGFDYLPGESVIVPGGEAMLIDFPEATLQTPTQCLALAIDREKIKETVDLLNERYAKAEDRDAWQLDLTQFHLTNSAELAGTVDRLVRVSQETNSAKDLFANLTLQELLLRLMQTQARALLFDNYLRYLTTHRFAYVVKYIKDHLAENLTIQKLSDLACMSQPHFFRSFKREFGLSPLEFIIRERLKTAKQYLTDPLVNVTEAALRTGFQNVNHFCTLFKKHEGHTPTSFKKQVLGLR